MGKVLKPVLVLLAICAIGSFTLGIRETLLLLTVASIAILLLLIVFVIGLYPIALVLAILRLGLRKGLYVLNPISYIKICFEAILGY